MGRGFVVAHLGKAVYRRTGARVRYFDEPIREQVASQARPALLHLMANHQPGGCDPAALQEVVDTYLRLNPLDEEVRSARERLAGEDRPLGA